MIFKVSTKSAIGILSLLVGYVDAAGTHPADALLKRDDGIAATGPADYPLRMSRKRLMDFPPIIGGGKAPPLLNSTQQDVGAQIVGGVPVDPPRKYKFFAWLFKSTSDGTYSCGGSLIAPNVVLTAAHCLIGSTPGIIYTDTDAHVKLGMHKINLDLEGEGEGAEEFDNIETIPIAGYVIHPDYNDWTLENDFALMQLQSASKLYADQVVELDSPSDDLELIPGDDLVIFGFGTLAYLGSTPNVMQEATLDYVDNEECAAAYDGLTSSMLCAARAGIDTCQGDSGGAILDAETKKLVGITSFGFECANPNYPGVYARVSSAHDDFILPYIDKLRDTLSDRLDCIDNSFYDSRGYDCITYTTFPHKCLSADERANAGVTANEACCACGGGTNEKRPSSTPSISSSPSYSFKPSGNPSVSSNPSDSPKPSSCNTPGWVDRDGYGCDWYEENDLPGCPYFGDMFEGEMGVADDNCCYCAGTGAPTRAPAIMAEDDFYSIDNNGEMSEQLLVLANDMIYPPDSPLYIYEITTEDPSAGECIISNIYGHPLAIQYIPPANTSASIKSVSCSYTVCDNSDYCGTALVTISLNKGSKSRKQSKAVKGTNTGGASSDYSGSIDGMSFGLMSFGSFSMIESMSIGGSSE